jgi:serine phosphatase RsbU (regulator of sigma subunit)/PAS domain-containing protein
VPRHSLGEDGGIVDDAGRQTPLPGAGTRVNDEATVDVEDRAERQLAAARLVPGAGGNPAVDRLAQLAARLLDAPSAQISLLTAEQIVAAGSGLPAGTVGRPSPLADSLCTVTAAANAPLVVSDASRDDRVAGLPPVTSGAVRAYLGVPLANSVGRVVGALCVFGPEPRPWSEVEVGILERLAESVMAELELSALSAEFDATRLRWEVAIAAADIGSFELDLQTGLLALDDRMASLYGYPGGALSIDRAEVLERVHPADRPASVAAFTDAVEAGGDYRVEYRVVLPDGTLRWVSVRARVRTDPAGVPIRLIGAAYDITDARSARDHAAHLVATMATGFASVDLNWRLTYLNSTGQRVLGLRSDAGRIGRVLWDMRPGLVDSELGRRCREAMGSGQPVELDLELSELEAWFEVRLVPGPEGLSMYFLDVTTRRLAREQAREARQRAEAAQARAEAALARLELLATVSADLADTLDAASASDRLARLVVPVLADWCMVSLVDEGQVVGVGRWHDDPACRPVLDRLASVPVDYRSGGPLWRVGNLRQPLISPSGVMAEVLARVSSPEVTDAIIELAPESSVILPLVARDRVVGVISLCRGGDRPAMSDDELATVRELADRAALALDNLRLYDRQRRLAEGLQRSLLTEPPEPDHCQIAVRYVAAAETASVGGDWFDAFLQVDGATVLVIGDVVGHDTEAAAAMGQLRGLLRGVAWQSDAGPAAVLGGLDAAIEGLQMATTATAVIARLEQTAEQRDRGIRVLRWSNAGHPPPITLHADGRVQTLEGPAPELLLGIDATTERTDSVIELEAGATVLLYTDGLVERRGQSLDQGLTELRRAAAALDDLSLEDFCDQLLARLLPERAEDDVALVAVRLHPQDRPRPAQAGPEVVPPEVPAE